MRSKLTILLILLSFMGFSQVPDTTTFSLQDVVNVVNPTTDDLVGCFADAVSGNFDATYSGSKNSLLNFRNYGATNIQVAYESTGGYIMSTQAVTGMPFIYPSSLQNNDILILILVNKESISFTTPSGWNLLGKVADATMSYGFYWRRVDGSEPPNVVTMGLSAKGTIVFNYRGANLFNPPYYVQAGYPSQGVSTGSSVGGNVPDLALHFWVMNQELTATNNSAAGWIENYNNGSSGTDGFTFVAASYLFGASPSTVLTYPNYNSYIATLKFVLQD